MARRPSARFVLTTFIVIITTIVLVLSSAVATSHDRFAVGFILVVFSAVAAWSVTGLVLQPIAELKQKLPLFARTRALAHGERTELAEIADLRLAVRAALEDLEERTRSAEQSERHVFALFERLNEGIVQISESKRFVSANAAARRFLGLPALPEGQSVSTLIRNPELRAVLERAADGENADAIELLVDGRQLLVSSSLLTVTIVDLTELRRLESVRRDFVANVSHELKTPLTSIRGYAETLLADDVPAESRRQFLNVILRNATRIQRIVEELLDLSRLQSGGWQPQMQSLDAVAVTHEVWAAYSDQAERKGIKFSIEGRHIVAADPDALRQVLSNLFENAIRYAPTNGEIAVKMQYVLPTGKRGRFVDIEVRDNGGGIPADSLARIFERFYRVDPARSREDGGTGLGLSIVKHFVDCMGGEVFAESELGKGTAVHIRLPEFFE